MLVLLANDNPQALEQLEKLVKVHSDYTVHSATDIFQFAKYLKAYDYHFAVIGSKLQSESSLQLLRSNQKPIPFIITSTDTADAYEAFKSGAIDYLLEPLNSDEAAASIIKVTSKLNEKNTDKVTLSVSPKKRFLVKIGDKMKSISVNDVAYIFAEGKLIYLVTASPSRKYIIDHTMDELDQGLLDPAYFFRINRKYFIQINSLEEVRPYVNSRLKILLNVPCEQDMIVSREKVVLFKRWLNL